MPGVLFGEELLNREYAVGAIVDEPSVSVQNPVDEIPS
jgi:hypothetical protein